MVVWLGTAAKLNTVSCSVPHCLVERERTESVKKAAHERGKPAGCQETNRPKHEQNMSFCLLLKKSLYSSITVTVRKLCLPSGARRRPTTIVATDLLGYYLHSDTSSPRLVRVYFRSASPFPHPTLLPLPGTDSVRFRGLSPALKYELTIVFIILSLPLYGL